MSKDKVFKKLNERVKKLMREYDKTFPGDPRRVEMENEISALYFEQHNLKSSTDGVVTTVIERLASESHMKTRV